MIHKWEMDVSRTRMDISVYVWKCRHCGCLQIRNGGVDGRTTYKPNDPAWSPFKTMTEEPPCLETHPPSAAIERDRGGNVEVPPWRDTALAGTPASSSASSPK